MKRELLYNKDEVIIMIQESLQQAFEENNGILTSKMAQDYGIHDSTLRKAVERQDIKKHCRGIYLLDDFYFDDLYLMQLRYAKGIYSHETAVMLHTLSTYSPFHFHVSFPRGYHLANAKELRFKPYYVRSEELQSEFIEVMNSWDSNPIRVTNLEKTVIDMLRHQRPMPGIVEEMINDYIRRKDKDIEKLKQYAVQFEVYRIVEERILPFV